MERLSETERETEISWCLKTSATEVTKRKSTDDRDPGRRAERWWVLGASWIGSADPGCLKSPL